MAEGTNDPSLKEFRICGKARFTLWPVANFGVLE